MARILPADNDKLLVFIRNITEYKRAFKEAQLAKTEAEKATESKSMLMASLSHEIRTPLSSIIGISGLMEETRLDDEQREYMDVIQISGNNLMNLINNILDSQK